MTRDDLFNTNAGVVRDIAAAISRNCPKALVGIITNPVNSCVPIASDVLKKVRQFFILPKKLNFDLRKLFFLNFHS